MAVRFNILTLFPEMFDIFNHSIIGNGIRKGLIEIDTYNIRDFTKDKHKKVDDYPYGGGCGMVISPQCVVDSIRYLRKKLSNSCEYPKVVFLGPRGNTFNQNMAKELSREKEIIFLCGHYEGIDERIYKYIDLEISLGDFILTGGEMACIPIIDSISRMIPEVLSSEESYKGESFYNDLLEYPQYTRPEIFEGDPVPVVLLSGHHENIRKWRRLQSLLITKEKRRDIFDNVKLNGEDKKLLEKYIADNSNLK